MNDSHCHFFSQRFFSGLGRSLPNPAPDAPETAALARLGWEPPGTADQLSDRWLTELDTHHVDRAALIASVPGDGESVARAVQRHPTRFVGFFMVDPTAPEAAVQVGTALTKASKRCVSSLLCTDTPWEIRRFGWCSRLPRHGRHRGVRPLRRFVDWRTEEAWSAEFVRRPARTTA